MFLSIESVMVVKKLFIGNEMIGMVVECESIIDSRISKPCQNDDAFAKSLYSQSALLTHFAD
jgi:hypothetical protein